MTERDIFIAALQQDNADARRAYLAEACGPDAPLRARVEELLAVHERAASFLECPVADPAGTVDRPSAAEEPGDVIGPYKLLEQIGEGGFGVVYLAEQTEPVCRKVALKVLKPGMDSRQVVARFEAERQALAIMDHPNIARVFDGGATPSGRPYFVMELVKGVPITEFCDQHHLTPRQRLELFVPVCQAIQHAHQKGIIHRDIKPSNVLVSRHDSTPVVKVIDFGVAKALGQSLTDKTLFTGVAQMIGTPLYMSPEQAGMSDLDVDTRSDIYSLGVLLYELLTGTTPFTKERFRQAAYDEIRRIIREEEPPKPSTRLSDSTDSLPSVAAQRQTEPARLTKLVRGELDWIVMRALEKDRTRRYETATGFAADVLRYLADEPVQACPPSAGYRFRKFARRNKGPVLAVGLVVVALLAGVIGTAWQAVRAERALEAASARAEGERQAKERAEANFALADEAVQKYLGAVTDDPELKRADFHRLRERLLASALPFLQKLTAQKSDDHQAEARRGRAYGRLGQVRSALGEHEAAVGDYEAARAIFDRLTTDFPGVPAYRHGLATSLHNLGHPLSHLGKRPEAAAALRQAVDIGEKLAAEFPAEHEYGRDVAATHNNLGQVLSDLGEHREAEAAYRHALGVMEKLAARFPTVTAYRLELARSHHNLGTVLDGPDRREEAVAAYRQALDIREKLAAEFPAEHEYGYESAMTRINLGQVLSDLGEHREAEAAYRHALGVMEKLAARFPTAPKYRQHMASCHDSLGNVLSDLGKHPDAEASLRRALEIREQLATDFPSVPAHQVELGAGYLNFGEMLRASSRNEAALGWFRKAIARFEPVLAREPRLATAREFLCNSHAARATALDALGRHAQAIPDWERALQLDDGREKATFRASLATSRLRGFRNDKDAAGCLAVAADYEAQKGAGTWELYTAAYLRALCAAAIPEDPRTPAVDAARLAKEQADMAMAWLHKAVAAGFNDTEHMKRDQDLHALRDREDFKKLVAELDAKQK